MPGPSWNQLVRSRSPSSSRTSAATECCSSRPTWSERKHGRAPSGQARRPSGGTRPAGRASPCPPLELFFDLVFVVVVAFASERLHHSLVEGEVSQGLLGYSLVFLLTGHNHHFERSKPMVYGRPTTHDHDHYSHPTGFVQVITGGGGKSLYEFTDPANFQSWSAAHANRSHYTWSEVADDVMKVRSIATDDPAGEVLDEWRLRVDGAQAPDPPDAANPCP